MTELILLSIYAILYAGLSLYGRSGFDFAGFIIYFLCMFAALYVFKNLKITISKGILMVFIIGYNLALFLFGDSKDFYILFYIQMLWYTIACLSYVIKRLRKRKRDFLYEIWEWFTVLLVFSIFHWILAYVIQGGEQYLDLWEFLIAIVVWKILIENFITCMRAG